MEQQQQPPSQTGDETGRLDKRTPLAHNDRQRGRPAWRKVFEGPMTPAIEVSQLHKHYGHVHALDGVSFTVEQGEFFALLGPNGAGKSTLINILAGLTRATSGTASVFGYDVQKQYRQARRLLGIVPQELVFDPFFTVREVLTIQSGYFGLGRENRPWINELIDSLLLTDKADTNMRALSGGMKRRVLIAQALVHKPPLIVLDEPTAGVDVELRYSLWKFIRRLHRQGHTIVLTTHYLREAQELCQRIAIVNHGRIVALDTKDHLMEKGSGGMVHVEIKLDPMRAFSVPDAWKNCLVRQDDCSVTFRIDRSQHTVLEFLDQLRAGGANFKDFTLHEADLEDIFVSLIHKT